MNRESCRRPGEEWCRKKCNIATSQYCYVEGKSQKTLSLGEAIKGIVESH